MRAKIDENMPVEAVRLLVEAGWDVFTVHDEHLVGASDQLVSAACLGEDRVLFSLDLDFADIRRYPRPRLTRALSYCGLWSQTGTVFSRCLRLRSRFSLASRFASDCGSWNQAGSAFGAGTNRLSNHALEPSARELTLSGRG